jgi:hypothetical protein
MTNPNDPATPTIEHITGNYGDTHVNTYFGLTKREYFAAMALQGLLVENSSSINADWTPKQAVKMADALIEELNKNHQP